jgi:DNA-binding MarR family transcriptional regulator
MPSTDHEASPHVELFGLIGVLARRRYQAAERSFAPIGLNHTEARLLTLLINEGGAASQDALSRQMFVDRSNAGRAFKRLEQAGYVTRRKGEIDSRTNLIDITPKGRDAAAETLDLGDEMARTFFGELSEDDAATIVQLLRQAL